MYYFGDGEESKAIQNMVTPVAIGNNWYMMLANVVKNNIPLMICKKKNNEVSWYEVKLFE